MKVEEKSRQINVDERRRVARSVLGIAVVPMRVKAKDSNCTVATYAFPDGGSHTSFITDSLLAKLEAKGHQSTLSLTTLEKEKSELKSSVISLEVSSLDGENTINVPSAFSVK